MDPMTGYPEATAGRVRRVARRRLIQQHPSCARFTAIHQSQSCLTEAATARDAKLKDYCLFTVCTGAEICEVSRVCLVSGEIKWKVLPRFLPASRIRPCRRTGALQLPNAVWMEDAPTKGGRDEARVYHTKPKEGIAYKLAGKCAQSTKRREPNRAPRNHAQHRRVHRS
jgi:hypothetical protein